MKLHHLHRDANKLIEHLYADGYSDWYINGVITMLQRILTTMAETNVQSYDEVFLHIAKQAKASTTLNYHATLFRLIRDFDLHGTYPCRSTNYEQLNSAFRRLVDEYCAEAKKTGKKDTTTHAAARNFSSFLRFVQNRGATSLDEITHEMEIAYFTNEAGDPNKSVSLRKQIACALQTCAPLYPNSECARVLLCLPQLRGRRKNIQYLTAAEISAIKDVLVSDASPLTFRDRAIGLLALETGLRGGDIAGLVFSAVDFNNDMIRLTQQKTGYPLEIPLPTHAGNAIYSYIHNERPNVDLPEIFIKQKSPYVGIGIHGLEHVCIKIMWTANVRQNAGDKKGLHLFRYRFATALLENDVPSAVISKSLGHACPESVEVYYGTDFVHLKETALSIEDFPVDLEALMI